MNLKVWLKLCLLFTALTFTITAIFLLKQGHLASFLTSMGLQKPGTRINWCQERVSQIFFYDTQSKLLEKGGKWLWINDREKALDYLRVEKWFAKYCQVPVKKVSSNTKKNIQPVLEAHFINDERMSLHSDGRNYFKINDQEFLSETLRKGLKELLAFDKKIE